MDLDHEEKLLNKHREIEKPYTNEWLIDNYKERKIRKTQQFLFTVSEQQAEIAQNRHRFFQQG